MRCNRVALVLLVALVFALAGSAQATVVTILPGQKITLDGVEPAEWQLSNGWSMVTNKMGVGRIMASGPSYCETPYQPFKAYQLTNAGGSDYPRWSITSESQVKQDLGRGAFYASCDRYYGGAGASGVTGSSVWLGTDQHGGRSLVGVKLSQIQKMKYYALVSGIPAFMAPGSADANWDSWKSAWANPRFPIQLQLTCEGPAGRRQLWYRPWGGHTTIGDQASDGRLSLWEQYDCKSYGRWFCPGDYEPDQPTQFENWNAVLAAYGDYTLVATSTGYDPANGQWKSPGYTDPTDPNHPSAGNVTDPPGRPACTATGKCLNFCVGARFWHLMRPDNGDYKTWYPESIGFRGQMDYFELGINYGTDQNPDVVDAAYDFEPAPNDLGPRFVYVNQASLNGVNNADSLIEKRGETENQHDPIANSLKNNREERLYDVLFKVSGKVTARSNPYFAFDDGAALSLPTRVFTVMQNRWESPTNSASLGQYWSSWGLLERFRPTGNAPLVSKPFVVWTSKTHNQRLQP